jgi:molybdopterin-guanine dinucleotide biosynthesis protein A
MGEDKAWAQLTDRRPLIARAVGLLKEIARDVLVVGNDPRLGLLGVPALPDHEGAGPLEGVAQVVDAGRRRILSRARGSDPLLGSGG